jgi:integrase
VGSQSRAAATSPPAGCAASLRPVAALFHEGQRQGSATRRRRDAAFLALAYSCGLRRSEAVAIDLGDVDVISGELRVRRGKGRKPRQVTVPPSGLPALQDWLQARGSEPGPLFCPVLKSGSLLREGDQLARLGPGSAWRICRERGLQARIRPPLLMICAGHGSGTCSTWASTWPPCRGWRGMLRRRRQRGTIAEIEACNAARPTFSTCLT